MPQCKMSNCREPALPTGKQYCAHHQSEYLRKQREYAAVQATLRKCECCGQPLTLTRHNNGENLCNSCSEVENQRRAVLRKEERFEEASTVDDLKSWIKEYLL